MYLDELENRVFPSDPAEPNDDELAALESEIGDDEVAPTVFSGDFGDDFVGRYLNDIGKYLRLSRRSEVELAIIQEGGGIKGREARDLLIESNLRLVIKVAKRYADRCRHLKLLDCIQAGNIGLMRAATLFNWRKGFKFSTYATWWIRQAISLEIKKYDRTIDLPVNIFESVARFEKLVARLSDELGRNPTIEEIIIQGGVSREDALRFLREMGHPSSLDEPVSESDDRKFSDFREDHTVVCSLEESVEYEKMKATIIKAMAVRLSAREKEALGLNIFRELSVREISGMMAISTMDAKYLLASARKKMAKSPELRDYIRKRVKI